MTSASYSMKKRPSACDLYDTIKITPSRSLTHTYTEPAAWGWRVQGRKLLWATTGVCVDCTEREKDALLQNPREIPRERQNRGKKRRQRSKRNVKRKTRWGRVVMIRAMIRWSSRRWRRRKTKRKRRTMTAQLRAWISDQCIFVCVYVWRGRRFRFAFIYVYDYFLPLPVRLVNLSNYLSIREPDSFSHEKR